MPVGVAFIAARLTLPPDEVFNLQTQETSYTQQHVFALHSNGGSILLCYSSHPHVHLTRFITSSTVLHNLDSSFFAQTALHTFPFPAARQRKISDQKTRFNQETRKSVAPRIRIHLQARLDYAMLLHVPMALGRAHVVQRTRTINACPPSKTTSMPQTQKPFNNRP